MHVNGFDPSSSTFFPYTLLQSRTIFWMSSGLMSWTCWPWLYLCHIDSTAVRHSQRDHSISLFFTYSSTSCLLIGWLLTRLFCSRSIASSSWNSLSDSEVPEMWSLNSENSSSSLSPAASLFSKIIFKVLRTETFFAILTVMHRQSYLFGVPHLLICWVWENIEWFSQDSQYKTRQHSFMQFKICCVISQQIGQCQEVTGWNNTKLNCVPEHHKSLTDDMFKHISIYRLLSDVTVKCLK